MNDDKLRFETSVDLTGWMNSIREGEAALARFVTQSEDRFASLRGPDMESFHSEMAGNANLTWIDPGQVAGAFGPAAAQIRASIEKGTASIGPMLAKTSAHIEAMAGSILATNARLDGEIRFPRTQKQLAAVRDYFGKTADAADQSSSKIVQVLGKVPRALSAVTNTVRSGREWVGWFESFHSYNSKIQKQLAAIKAPALNFGPAAASVRTLDKSVNRATESFRGLSFQIAAAVGFAGTGYAIGGFLKSGIKGASDLNEQLNNTRTRLGNLADGAIDFSAELAKSFGISRRETLAMTTDFAGLGEALGKMGGDDLLKSSKDLTQRVIDFSSSTNKSVEEVSQAFRVVLSGEQSDLMKRYGTVTTEATVKQYAFATGIAKLGSELTEEQKYLARQNILMDKTAFAAGDLTNTINDPANAFRRFQGQVDNLGTSIGTTLLPVANELLGSFNRMAGQADSAFGGSRSAIESWADSAVQSISTVELYLRNWEDTQKLATLSAEQGLTNFSEKFTNHFAKIGDEIRKAIESPLDFIGNELNHFWLNFQNIYKNIKELTTKGIGGNFVDINAGWDKKDLLKNQGPNQRPAPADRSAEMAEIANRIESRRVERFKAISDPVTRTKPPIDEVTDAMVKAAKKQEDEMDQFVRSLKDKVRTPLEEYGQEVEKARKALESGRISQEEFSRAEKLAAKESGLNEVKLAGALEANSREAYSLIAANSTGRTGLPETDRIQRGQLDGIIAVAKGVNQLVAMGRRAPVLDTI